MISDTYDSDWDEDDGLPDAAFTKNELEAGVQHIMRSGRDGGRESQPQQMLPTLTAQLNDNVLHFATYPEAQTWAKTNPGSTFTRAVDGNGYEAKVRSPTSTMSAKRSSAIQSQPYDPQHEIDDSIRLMRELRKLSPHMHDIWNKSGCNSPRSVRPFLHMTFTAEIERLGPEERVRLRQLLCEKLQSTKKFLHKIEYAISRDRRMKPGNYCEDVNSRLIELQEQALNILDEHINKLNLIGPN